MDNVLGQVESAILKQYKKEKTKAKDRSTEQQESDKP